MARKNEENKMERVEKRQRVQTPWQDPVWGGGAKGTRRNGSPRKAAHGYSAANWKKFNP